MVPESARPSGARVRKSLFDLLASRAPAGRFPTFLDLHGGSGAIGLEAASRGHTVTLIEKEPRSVKAIESNARALELKVTVYKGQAEHWLERIGSYDIVFSDPPYQADIPKLTKWLLAGNAVKPGGFLICQHPNQVKLESAEGYELETRVMGSNTLSIYRKDATPSASLEDE